MERRDGLGGRILWARHRAHLTQQQLAERAGVTQRNIVRWENNQHMPSGTSLAAIAKATGVRIDDLLVSEADAPFRAGADHHRSPRKRAPSAERKAARPRMRGVYFVQAQDGGPIKMGFSTRVLERVDALQAGSPVRLSLLGTLPVNQLAERCLHGLFAGGRLHGEWFSEDTPGLLPLIHRCSEAKPEDEAAIYDAIIRCRSGVEVAAALDAIKAVA